MGEGTGPIPRLPLQAPLANAITLGIPFQHVNLGGHKGSVPSKPSGNERISLLSISLFGKEGTCCDREHKPTCKPMSGKKCI